MSRKTFVYAVHALDHDRAIEKAREGVMPNLLRLVERGSYGTTKSVFSTASPVDYTSMLTGTTHTTHGIDDFQTNTREGFTFARHPGKKRVVHPAEADDTRLYTSYDVPVPWIWELMTEHRAMQFGVFSPTTYPAPELPNDGVWVSGYWSKPTNYLRDQVAACNHQDIREELLEHYPDYSVTPLFALPPLYPADTNTEMAYHRAFLEHNMHVSKEIQKARLEVFGSQDWDVFFTEEGLCDNVQHILWPRSEENPAADEVDRQLRDEALLDRYYRYIDDILGRYLDRLPDDANVIVISCHGHEETTDDYYMHDRFTKLYKHGIWETPDNWEFREERPEWSPPTRSGHTYDGLYVVAGPAFQERDETDPISCMDFTPLMLELYGYDIPDLVDGRVPAQILR